MLDAVVIIAFFSPDNVHHARAKNLIATAPGPFLMHSLTAAETLVAAARQGRDAAMWAQMQKLGVEMVQIGSGEPLLLAQLRATHGLKMPDTCVLAAATHRKVRLATFDEQLGKVADTMSLRYTIPEVT